MFDKPVSKVIWMTRILRFCLLTLFFLPLLYYPHIGEEIPYENELNFFLIALALLSTLFCFVVFLSKHRCSLITSYLDVTIVLLCVTSFFSLIVNKTSPLASMEFRMLIGLNAFYFMVVVLLRSDGRNHSHFRFLFWTILFVAWIESVIAILQNYSSKTFGSQSYFKVVGTFGNPDHFAGFISSALPTGLAIYFSEDILLMKRIALAMLLSILFILPATLIRSSWLGVTVGVGLFALLRHREKLSNYFLTRHKWQLGISLALALSLGLIVFMLYKMKPASADGRILIWRITTYMIRDKPLFGHGLGNYRIKYMDYQAEFFNDPENVKHYMMVAGNVHHAHNELLQIFAETGMIGLLLFLVVLFFAYRRTYKSLRSKRLSMNLEFYLIGCVASVTTILVVSLFSFPMHIPATALIFFSSLAGVSTLTDKMEDLHLIKPQLLLNRISALVMVAVIVLIVYDVPRRITAYKIWDEAYSLFLDGEYKGALALYRTIQNELSNDGKYHFMLGGTYVIVGMYREGISELEKSKRTYTDPEIYVALGAAHEKLGEFCEAETSYLIASRMMPHWMYPHYLLAKMYKNTGRLDKAKIEAEIVLKMPVKVQLQAVEEMRREIHAVLDSLCTVN